ncbi:hypothetical protein BH23ACT2_BH23ACT2_03900 [soil metagenome]
MALQGDLDSFALADVLRLLSATTKSGRLAVASRAGSGEVWVRDGDLAGGTATTAPHASAPAEVVFELMRFGEGSFVFDEDDGPIESSERATAEDTIGAAEALVAEWTLVEAVVPSMQLRVTLAPELGVAEIGMTADRWRVLAAVGDATTVRALGDRFSVTDLIASQLVKDLVECGLVELSDAHETAPAPPAPLEPEPVADLAALDVTSPEEELRLLSADGGPVVLEDHDDALLPEPLPDPGTAYAADATPSSWFDAQPDDVEPADLDPGPVVADPSSPGPAETALWWADDGVEVTAPDKPGRLWDSPEVGERSYDDRLLGVATEPETGVTEDDLKAAGRAVDDRRSLLRFLSSVKS